MRERERVSERWEKKRKEMRILIYGDREQRERNKESDRER